MDSEVTVWVYVFIVFPIVLAVASGMYLNIRG